MAKSVILISIVLIMSEHLRAVLLEDGSACRTLMGRQAKRTNCERGRVGFESKGPLWIAKRNSLKFASHEIKKQVVAPRKTEESLSGRSKRSKFIGMIERNLEMDLVLKILLIEWQ